MVPAGLFFLVGYSLPLVDLLTSTDRFPEPSVDFGYFSAVAEDAASQRG
jgi:hypothetical protein